MYKVVAAKKLLCHNSKGETKVSNRKFNIH